MGNSLWLVYALAGAFAAALVNLFMKRSLEKLDATVAITLQSGMCLLTLLALAAVSRKWALPGAGMRRPLLFAAAAGVAAGLAWFFGYRALKLADVSKATSVDRISLAIAVVLAVIFLGERPAVTTWIGVALMIGGAVLVTLGRAK